MGGSIGASIPLACQDWANTKAAQRENPDAIGMSISHHQRQGQSRAWSACIMHSSLAVTLDSLPLGFSAIKFWTRSKFKGAAALKKEGQPNAGSHRAEGEFPLAGKHSAICRLAGGSGPMRAYRRP